MSDRFVPTHVGDIAGGLDQAPEGTRLRDHFVGAALAGVYTPLTAEIVARANLLSNEDILSRAERYKDHIIVWEVTPEVSLAGVPKGAAHELFQIDPADPGIDVVVGAYGERFSRALALSAAVVMDIIRDQGQRFFRDIDRALEVLPGETFFTTYNTMRVGVETTVAALGLVMIDHIPGHDDPYAVADQLLEDDVINHIARVITFGTVQPQANGGRVADYRHGIAVDEGGQFDIVGGLLEALRQKAAKKHTQLVEHGGAGSKGHRAMGCFAARRNVIPLEDIPGIDHPQKTRESGIEILGHKIVAIARLLEEQNIV